MTNKRQLREAMQCCKDGTCNKCPLQQELCDTLYVEMVEVPEQLLDLIDENLKTYEVQ